MTQVESQLPALRIRAMNAAQVRADGDYVLYWMIATRRATHNFALERAIECAVKLKRPLVVFEALRCGYRWASDRLHRFVIDGMRDNAAAFRELPVTYYPYVEPKPNFAHGLLATLAERACIVVTDDFPTFFLPTMVKAVARRLPVNLEAIDSNGLLPMFATEQVFPTAFAFRRYLQKNLPEHLPDMPKSDPFRGAELPPPIAIPPDVLKRWPAVSSDLLESKPGSLAAIEIDHSVPPGIITGGSNAAEQSLKQFVVSKLGRYDEDRNEPSLDGATGLSPYLHFGHISPWQIFDAIAQHERWSPDKLAAKAAGKREGWWGMSKPAEALLDQVVTWREVGYNFCSHREDYDQYESLPDWAQKTLAEHAGDPRVNTYTLAEFESAQTHDPLWNAAQTQLVREGRMHNYLRMLWGKKILEWSPSPREALAVMIELNNKYALDGRNPNSYSGIFWVLGRYDRPWGPERPIYGKIRYMTSENTARKHDVKEYLVRYRST